MASAVIYLFGSMAYMFVLMIPAILGAMLFSVMPSSAPPWLLSVGKNAALVYALYALFLSNSAARIFAAEHGFFLDALREAQRRVNMHLSMLPVVGPRLERLLGYRETDLDEDEVDEVRDQAAAHNRLTRD